jgi:RNA 3'-terminal phosphate cyclase (ATP)
MLSPFLRARNAQDQVIEIDGSYGEGGGQLVRTAWAESDAGLLGASRVAERGVRAETLGASVGQELAADIASGATLDMHAADQILVYLAMAAGRSSFTTRAVSSHARTAMWLIAQFVPARFTLEAEGALSRISATAGY